MKGLDDATEEVRSDPVKDVVNSVTSIFAPPKKSKKSKKKKKNIFGW